jgi:hypothetical protein
LRLHHAEVQAVAHNWTKLFDLLYWLQTSAEFKFAVVNHEQALIHALLSKEVPIRGRKDWLSSEFDRIELKLSTEDQVSFVRCCIRQGLTTYYDVQADQNKVEPWLRDNVVEEGAVPLLQSGNPTDSAIAQLKEYLSTRQAEPPMIKRELYEALKAGKISELGNKFANLSGRQFSRVWAESAPMEWRSPGFRRGRARKTKTPH